MKAILIFTCLMTICCLTECNPLKVTKIVSEIVLSHNKTDEAIKKGKTYVVITVALARAVMRTGFIIVNSSFNKDGTSATGKTGQQRLAERVLLTAQKLLDAGIAFTESSRNNGIIGGSVTGLTTKIGYKTNAAKFLSMTKALIDYVHKLVYVKKSQTSILNGVTKPINNIGDDTTAKESSLSDAKSDEAIKVEELVWSFVKRGVKMNKNDADFDKTEVKTVEKVAQIAIGAAIAMFLAPYNMKNGTTSTALTSQTENKNKVAIVLASAKELLTTSKMMVNAPNNMDDNSDSSEVTKPMTKTEEKKVITSIISSAIKILYVDITMSEPVNDQKDDATDTTTSTVTENKIINNFVTSIANEFITSGIMTASPLKPTITGEISRNGDNNKVTSAISQLLSELQSDITGLSYKSGLKTNILDAISAALETVREGVEMNKSLFNVGGFINGGVFGTGNIGGTVVKPENEKEPPAKCDEKNGYEYSNVTERCYKLHSEVSRWLVAEKTCADEGALLAVINSREESQVLGDIKSREFFVTLIGVRRDSEGHWVTVTGEDVVTAAGFDVWATDKDRDEKSFLYGCLYKEGKIGGVSDASYSFICEKAVEA